MHSHVRLCLVKQNSKSFPYSSQSRKKGRLTRNMSKDDRRLMRNMSKENRKLMRNTSKEKGRLPIMIRVVTRRYVA